MAKVLHHWVQEHLFPENFVRNVIAAAGINEADGDSPGAMTQRHFELLSFDDKRSGVCCFMSVTNSKSIPAAAFRSTGTTQEVTENIPAELTAGTSASVSLRLSGTSTRRLSRQLHLRREILPVTHENHSL